MLELPDDLMIYASDRPYKACRQVFHTLIVMLSLMIVTPVLSVESLDSSTPISAPLVSRVASKLKVLESLSENSNDLFKKQYEKAKSKGFAKEKRWKCISKDFLDCLYGLGRNGIYKIPASTLFDYYPDESFESIKDSLDFIKVSKRANTVELQFFLKDRSEVVFQSKFKASFMQKQNIKIKHLSKLRITHQKINQIEVNSLPSWILSLLPLQLRQDLFQVSEDQLFWLKSLSATSIDEKISIKKIRFDGISIQSAKAERSLFSGIKSFGSWINTLIIADSSTNSKRERLYLFSLSKFFVPVIKSFMIQEKHDTQN